MVPKQKAESLISMFETEIVMWSGDIETSRQNVKRCALIVCEQVIRTLDGVWADVAGSIARSCEDTLAHRKFWQEVEKEIEFILPYPPKH